MIKVNVFFVFFEKQKYFFENEETTVKNWCFFY